jgi:hypothetical protein
VSFGHIALMSKTRALLLALAALIIGAVAGGWGVSKFWGRLTADLSASSMAAEASTTVRILERLRDGNTTGPVELLEIKLDGALIGLGAIIPEIPESRRDPNYIRAVGIARDYRSKFPRTNDSPDVSDGVARAFSLLE